LFKLWGKNLDGRRELWKIIVNDFGLCASGSFHFGRRLFAVFHRNLPNNLMNQPFSAGQL